MKTLSFFLFLIAFVISPLRVSAMMERSTETREASSRTDTTAENTVKQRVQAAKDTKATISTAASSDSVVFDDSNSAQDESISTMVVDPSLLTTPSEEKDDAISLGGLSNNGADCFINSSLQLSKAFKDRLDPRALDHMPFLAKFLNEGLSTDGECRALRQEMATQVVKADQDLSGVIVDGTAHTQQDAAAFLRLLLSEVKARNVLFVERLENLATKEVRTEEEKPEGILQLALPEDKGASIAMQDLVDKKLISRQEQRWIDEDTTSPVVEVQSCLTLKADSIPPTLVLSLGRYSSIGLKNKINISGFKQNITFPTEDGKQITYEPTAIICHGGASLESGHYVCYRKEDEEWLLFNDKSDVARIVPLEGSFASKNCYIISYKRTDTADPIQGGRDLVQHDAEQSLYHSEKANYFANLAMIEMQEGRHWNIPSYLKISKYSNKAAGYWLESSRLAASVQDVVRGRDSFVSLARLATHQANFAEDSIKDKSPLSPISSPREQLRIRFFNKLDAMSDEFDEFLKDQQYNEDPEFIEQSHYLSDSILGCVDSFKEAMTHGKALQLEKQLQTATEALNVLKAAWTTYAPRILEAETRIDGWNQQEIDELKSQQAIGIALFFDFCRLLREAL